MCESLYYKINSILKINFIAKILATILYCPFVLRYLFKAVARKKDIITIAKEEAEEYLKSKREYVDTSSEIVNEQIDESIDLSIIIPCYNVEKYLRECLDSVVNQKTKYNYEIIAVNDGSPDKCIDILREYSSYKNFTIIDQENRGLSGARNTGLNRAKGKYITFVDSDDYVSTDLVEICLDKVYSNNLDMFAFGYDYFQDGTDTFKNLRLTDGVILDFKSKIIATDYFGFAWGKIYKRETWNSVRFPEKMWFEDTITQFILFRLVCRFEFKNELLYHYRLREASICGVFRGNYKTLDTIWILYDICKTYERIGLNFDEVFYHTLIKQMGKMTYCKLTELDRQTQYASFIVCCELVNKYKISGYRLNTYLQRELEKAFTTRDFELYKIICIKLA